MLDVIFVVKALLGKRNGKPQDKYSRLDREIERSNQTFIEDQQQQQSVSTLSLYSFISLNLYGKKTRKQGSK